MAAAFALQPAQAQPVPKTVVHGGATFATSGSNLTVTTTNVAGTNHSVIDWSSFSVPAGSVTSFVQPSAASTSINRVVDANPSRILGRLDSNGRLVLVNPWGIAVGQGAQVDTAGFVASTLAMSDADALAGRLRFAGSGGLLQVDGAIKAQGGDVVLIAPQVRTGATAVIESDGAAVLAAGQKVEITGRGLEGILMEVQAGDQAVNLGSLRGDAVGIFAGTLRHSGLIQAQAVSTEGGKVVLKAAGDAIVDGQASAQAAGARGGSIDVFGQRVGLFAGAALDASGAAGGGQVRVGGDYQGRNTAVPNASATYVDAAASVRADATQAGDGGRVIVWADDATRMDGRISARGGAQGGNGGFVENSGKQHLDFNGEVDLRAPAGTNGTLLLDPTDIDIVATAAPNPTFTQDPTTGDYTFVNGGTSSSTITAKKLGSQLDLGNVLLTTTSTAAGLGNITQQAGANISWTAPTMLGLDADASIGLNASISNPNGGLSLAASSGNVTGATATLNVGQLYAEARGTTSTTGKVTLTNTANTVGTIAGLANGPGAEFSFANATGFTVGTVSGAYANANGIAVDDSGSAIPGSLTLAAVTGNVTVAPLTRARAGGNVLLKAQAGDVELKDGSMVASQYGQATLDASRDVVVARAVSGSSVGETDLYAEALTLKAGRNVEIATQSAVSAGSMPPQVLAGGSTQLTITAGGDVLMGAPATAPATTWPGGTTLPTSTTTTTSAPAPWIELRGGAVTIGATGQVDFGTTAYVAGYGSFGGIGVTAGTAIAGNGNFITDGGAAGGVTLAANGGSLTFGSIVTRGSYGTIDGGVVKVNATGDILGSLVETVGYGGSIGQNAGNGADVSLVSSGGNLTVAAVHTDGAAGADGFRSGNGGAILLQAKGTGTSAGNVTVLAPTVTEHDYEMGTTRTFPTGLSSHGGNTDPSSSVPSAGGNGGAITIDAARDIRVGDSTLSTMGGLVDAGGGTGVAGSFGSASGGMAGNVTITSSLGAVSLLPGVVINAASGAGSTGSAGANVTISAGTNATLSDIDASGADSTGAGATGGAGGKVSITAGGAIAASSVKAIGGKGGPGANGGAGGTIALTRTAGDLSADSTMHLLAGGGAGGNGGSVSIDAPGGVVHLQGAEVGIAGGAAGTFSANAQSVDVASDFLLQGTWNNGSIVDLHASILGGGTFDNKGTIRPGGLGTVGIATIDGHLVMEAGSTLAIDVQSASASDLLKVAGKSTIDANSAVAVNYLPNAAFAGADTFSVLQAGTLSAPAMPLLSEQNTANRPAAISGFTLGSTATDLFLTAVPAPAAAPTPAPTPVAGPAPIPVVFAEIVAPVPLAQLDKPAAQDDRKLAKDDVVITDTACKP